MTFKAGYQQIKWYQQPFIHLYIYWVYHSRGPFNSDGMSSDHVNTRISKCHKAFYELRDADMAYPGAHKRIITYL